MLWRPQHTSRTNTELIDLTANKKVEPVLNDVSLVSIGYDDLPYKHLVTTTTHLLYIQFDDLLLAVDFVTEASGHLLVTQAQDTIVESRECRVVKVEDIPITRELQFDCLLDSNKLNVLFQNSSNNIVYVTFVWDFV